MVRQRDAFPVSPIDPQALEPPVAQTKGAGVPMIGVARGAPGSDALLGLDEQDHGLSIGRIAGQD